MTLAAAAGGLRSIHGATLTGDYIGTMARDRPRDRTIVNIGQEKNLSR